MAPPSKIKTYIERYKRAGGKVSVSRKNYENPGYFREKLQAEELKSKNEELEMINKSMVGRELKMIELKKEIEELKNRLKTK